MTVVSPCTESQLAAPQARLLRTSARAFLLAATGYQLACAFQDVTFFNVYVLRMDDAYYYFQVARNIADRGWVTFDGIHSTSGIQVVWGGLLAGLATVVHDRVAFLRAVLVVCALLNLATGWLLGRFGGRLHSGAAGDVAMILWSGFMLGLSPTMIGVEYPLHALILVGLLSVWWRVYRNPHDVPRSRLQALGLLLTLNYWNRLDSASLSVLVGLAITLSLVLRRSTGGSNTRASRRALIGSLVALGIWPVVGAAGYAAVCMAIAGTPMPLSGLVKTFYASHHFDHAGLLTSLAGHVSWWLRVMVRPPLDAASTAILAGHQPLIRPLPLAVLAVSCALTISTLAGVIRERHQQPGRFEAARFIALVALFGAVHAAVIVATIGHFSHVTQHYYGWLFLAWCLWMGLAVQRWLTSPAGPAWQRPAAIALLAGIVAANLGVAAQRFTTAPDPSETLHNRRVPVIAWIGANLPAGTRLGAWNAGQIGYFSERTVVNLDGLANDNAYFAFLKSGAPLAEYLRREHIEYIVDNNAPDLTMPYLASWDRDKLFHFTEPSSGLEPVYVEANQADPIVVLRVKGVSRP